MDKVRACVVQIKCVQELNLHFLPAKWHWALGAPQHRSHQLLGTFGDALKVLGAAVRAVTSIALLGGLIGSVILRLARLLEDPQP